LVLERAESRAEIPKANGVVGRAVVELERRGLLRGTEFRAARAPRFRYGPFTLRLGLLRSPLHVLPIPQRRLEELLERRAVGLGATVHRGHEVTGFEQDDAGVTVHVTTSGAAIERRCRYLVGCDGAHSTVRKHVGIGFPGVTSPDISRLARVTLPADMATREGDQLRVRDVGALAMFRPHLTDGGSVTIAPANALDRTVPDDVYIVSTHEPQRDSKPTDELSHDELRESLRRVLGADLPFAAVYGARSVVANSRQAEHYRSGRVLLAGDAAHVFSAGGSALNVGLLDAISLADKLARVLGGHAPEALLDAYAAERHSAGGRTLAHTRIQLALEASDETGRALRVLFGALLEDRATARRIGTLLEG
jgi:2-polyprenyl-6-methoxyphenol hydroxylase-like FAD-dependent oxidoreductase